MIPRGATFGCGDTMKKMTTLSAVCLVLSTVVGVAAAGTETISFPGCSTPMTFQFSPFWDQRKSDEAALKMLMQNPANQHDYARIFVVETGDGRSRPIVSFSTLGPLKSIQGKIAPPEFEDMAVRMDDVLRQLLEESRKYAVDYMDRLKLGMPLRSGVTAREVLFLGKKRQDSMFSFYTINMLAAEDRSRTYFGSYNYYYKDGCVACLTLMLPAARLSSREALGILGSITFVESESAPSPATEEIHVHPDIDGFLRYHDEEQGAVTPD